MQHKLVMLLMAAFISIASVHAQTGNEIVKHKVVIQMSSNDTLVWKGLMNNLKNLKAGWVIVCR